MIKDFSFISIIVPARNEEKFIRGFLDSLLKQNYPKEKIEIILADGKSGDKTVKIAKEYFGRLSGLRIITNAKKITSAGLNLAIKAAKGGIVARMDVHAEYPADYLSRLVSGLEKYQTGNIGPRVIASPATDTLEAKAIAFCLNSSFGAFGSDFRLGADKPIETDTVFNGCWKKEIFEKIGYFNENLIRSQDLEFNLRLKKAGAKIVLLPDLAVKYFPKTTLKEFLRHNFKDGFWAIYPLRFVKMKFKLRHYLPLAAVSGFLALMFFGFFFWPFRFLFVVFCLVYLVLNFGFSVLICLKEKSPDYFRFLFLAFVWRHFGYGFGSLLGAVKLMTGR